MLQRNSQKGEETYCNDNIHDYGERLHAKERTEWYVRFLLLLSLKMTFLPDFGATITPATGGHRCPSGPVLMAYTRLPALYNYSKEFELPVEKVKATMNRKQFVGLRAP
ncbi:unnamed protein product [Toxocara canis]|uniref:Uncharacterized protein n=1 Tax=Toxocara canis TaxID=6265 RepID=A0A183UQ96_TOXCA|nr:unnamed protein product [Toxocara canis]